MDTPPLALRIAIRSARLSCMQGIEVNVEIQNQGGLPVAIPSLYDQTGALAFELRAPGGKLIARLDGLTRQAASSAGRLDYSVLLDTLAPGASWSRRFELCRYGALPPAGKIEVSATFDYRPLGIALQSETARVSLERADIVALSVSRDNPVLDRATLLFTARDSDGTETHILRQHSASRPLASWCSNALDLGAEVRDPFLATDDCFETKSFAPFFLQWVLWSDGARLFARLFRSGRPAGDVINAPIPEGRKLLRVAYLGPDGTLHVLFEGPRGTLESRAFTNGLPLIFAQSLSCSRLAAAADREGLYIVAAHPWLSYYRLSHAGELLDAREVLRTPRIPGFLTIDAGEAIRAIYTDMPHGRSARLVHVSLRTDQVAECSFDLAGHRGEIREAAFARDASGCFHFLFSTSDRRLLLYSGVRGPVSIARGGSRFFPEVIAGEDVFLGFYESGKGYRFIDHRPRGI